MRAYHADIRQARVIACSLSTATIIHRGEPVYGTAARHGLIAEGFSARLSPAGDLIKEFPHGAEVCFGRPSITNYAAPKAPPSFTWSAPPSSPAKSKQFAQWIPSLRESVAAAKQPMLSLCSSSSRIHPVMQAIRLSAHGMRTLIPTPRSYDDPASVYVWNRGIGAHRIKPFYCSAMRDPPPREQFTRLAC